MNSLRILMLEDSSLDAELICAQLETGGIPATVRRVDARADFLAELAREPLDLILADFSLPAFDGISALQLARDQRPEVPFLFVSGALGEELAIETLKSGATDYVLKQRLERLVPSVRRALAEAKERQERKRAEEALRFLADASALLGTSLDYPETLTRVCRVAVPQLADGCVLYVRDDAGTPRAATLHHDEPWRSEHLVRLRASGQLDGLLPGTASRQAMEGRRTVHRTFTGLAELGPQEKGLVEALELEGMLVSPLFARGRVLGALAFLRGKGARRYDVPETRLCEEFARRAALAVDSARLHQDVQLADRRKDEFLAMLAHELRNPLAPIVTALEVMKSRFPEDEILGRTRAMVERQARHMARLIDDLLDVSRITRGKIALRRQVLEAQAAARQAAESCRPALEARQHHLHLELAKAPLHVDADPARLEQVLSNLLHNAAKYTEPGGELSLCVDEEGGQVVFRVRDSGVGIPPEMLGRIFEMFVQVSPTLDRSQGGLGLGLTLVKKLVELHGGRVEARSEGEGKGSEFTVRLPRTHAATTRRTHSGEVPRVGGHLLRVLVVEDNADARESLRELLLLWGHSVETAGDGQAAVERLCGGGFDLALVDVGLPKLDGYSVARAVREVERRSGHRRIRMVALTGYGQPEDRKRALESGFDLHRTKPLESQDLRTLLAGGGERRHALGGAHG